MAELKVEQLDGGYPHRRVLSGVSLTVRSGEMLALIGPNGAGKTTLLRALARQLRPSAGTVTLDGIDLWSRGPGWVARRIALCASARTPDRALTVLESVALGRAPHRGWLLPLTHADQERVRHALERTGLGGLMDRPVTELSAGEAQRVLLARALAQEPGVLLVDEPTAHLDLHFQGEILDRLAELAREDQMAIVLALHDLNLAALWADRVVLLANGRVLASGSPKEVLTAEQLSGAYQASLVVTRHPVFGTPLVMPAPGERERR